MKRKLKILILALLCTLCLGVQAQTGSAQRTGPRSNPGSFYFGLQANSPLMWGDLFSLGKETRFGYGGGLFVGYTLNEWLSPELSFDYGVGQLGAKVHQLDDYMDKAGIIRYLQRDPSDVKLGDIYSKSQYMQAGLRLQVGVLSFIRDGEYTPFDIEVAPALYAQKFSPELHTVSDNKKLDGYGITESGWNYAVGGDLGLRYHFIPQLSAHLRAGLLWMRNEAFEGVNNDPVWRVNLMGNASLGITFHLGKKSTKKVARPPVVYQAQGGSDNAVHRAEQERLARERSADAAEAKRLAYIREVENLQIPALYFRRGASDIDLKRYQSNLEEMVQIVKRFADAKITIEGWSDTTGTESGNARLSQLRADALRDYLINSGVDVNRIVKAIGMGVDSKIGNDDIARRAMIKLKVD